MYFLSQPLVTALFFCAHPFMVHVEHPWCTRHDAVPNTATEGQWIQTMDMAPRNGFYRTSHWEGKTFPGIYYSLSRTVQFVPKVEHTALEKIRATKQQNEKLVCMGKF